MPVMTTKQSHEIQVIPITHASLILKWADHVIYVDPTGGVAAYIGQSSPHIILVTDIHTDHLSVETLAVIIGQAAFVVPQAVKEMLPPTLAQRAQVLANGTTATELGFTILAAPMYNLPESAESRHVKGRGNGYIIEKTGKRVYIAGDTAGIPEMRSLTNIDIAFIPMNLPYTMGVEEAADAVLAFKPKQVYPYHYRGQGVLADTNKFKELVYTGNKDIEVELLNWYPKTK